MTDQFSQPPSDERPSLGHLVPVAASVPASRDPYVELGRYGADPGIEGDLRQTLLEYLRIFNKRKGLIAGIAIAVLALGAVRTLMQTPLYTSSVRLQIDRNVVKVVEGGNVTPLEGSDAEFLRTQYELLQSRAMAERVASALNLGSQAGFLKPREFSIVAYFKSLFLPAANTSEELPVSALAAADEAAVGILLANRAVRPVPGSRLVDLAYADPDPSRAKQVVTAFADAYVASNLDKRFEANAYAKTFLEDQIKQLKIRLEQSEKVLLDFAQKEQIVAVTEKSSIAENNLAAANSALGSLVSERIKNEQQWKQVDSAAAIDLPQLLTNSVIDGLRAKRNALVTEYQEKLETFKPSYPAMIQIDNKIKEIDRQLAAEVETIKSSLKGAFESSLAQEGEMKSRIETLRADVLDLQKRSIEYNILKREVDTNRELYNGLLQRFKEVDIAGGVGANNIFIVDKAQLPQSPSSPQLSRALLLALMLGLGLGLGAAYILEFFDDTVNSPEEIETVTGLPTLGVIPIVKSGASIDEDFYDPHSALAEAYRSLCTALQFSTDSGVPKTLLITSAGPNEGKSFTSLAIARHFSVMGLKVLLIDCDLRNSSLHTKLGLDNSIGLSNYLTGACTPPETFQATQIENLALMASGPLPPNPAELLNSPRFSSLLSLGHEVFDFIVLDGPPVMGLADAALLSNAATGTLFIAASGQARKGLMRGALKRLQLGRGPLIGTVMTKFDAKTSGYGYGYGHGYGYGYGSGAIGYSPQGGGQTQSSPQLARSNVDRV